MNHNLDAMKTTFTLTNVAAQHSIFNQKAWNQLECMVRQYLEREIPRQEAYLMTGKFPMIKFQKKNIRRPVNKRNYP